MLERWAMGLIPLLVLIALVVVLAKLVDLWRRRRRERAALRGAVSDALLGERRLTDSTVLAKVRIPFWSGSPATIVLTGRASDAETHAITLRIARAAATTVRHDFTTQHLLFEGRRPSSEHAA